jgi:hypothetical protein
MKLDPDMHIGMHLVSFGKSGVTYTYGYFILSSYNICVFFYKLVVSSSP